MAFFIYSFLPDKWEGMSGSYLGKDWTELPFLFDLYEVDQQKEVLSFMKIYEKHIVTLKASKQKEQRKAEERRSASSGKNYTHNVTG